MSFEDKLIKNLVFGRSGLNSSVFEKLLISYSCISFMKYYALRSFCINCFVFQKSCFSRFLIDRSYYLIDWKCHKNFGLNLFGLISARLMLDRSKLKNLQFLSFWPKIFYASFIFRIHMHCIVFVSILQFCKSYLSLFSHITCIHFAKMGTQLDLKIDWLIFELCTF